MLEFGEQRSCKDHIILAATSTASGAGRTVAPFLLLRNSTTAQRVSGKGAKAHAIPAIVEATPGILKIATFFCTLGLGCHSPASIPNQKFV